MKIVVVGNLGYVGPVVVAHLRQAYPEANLVGFDTGFFAGCLLDRELLPEIRLTEQAFGDVRHFPASLLEGADAVVQLAALSNDPLGKSFEQATHEINGACTLTIAEQAKAAGVGHFVFASSCSVYGAGGSAAKDEHAELAPQTAYAISKIATEERLKPLAEDGFTVTCLRFATACGYSPRLRLDLVLNDFVASALASGRIEILSNGEPWRPLIHVKDMARAIDWACGRPLEAGGPFLAVNVGSADWNYQIIDLARAVSRELGDVAVSVNENASPDKRSYRVDFGRFERLAPDHQPRMTLPQTVRELAEALTAIGFADRAFRDGGLIRLNFLNRLIAEGRLDNDLNWV